MTSKLGDAILESELSSVERHGLIVDHSLSRSVGGKTIVQVLNPSPSPVTIHKNEKIRVLRPVADVCMEVCAATSDLRCNPKVNLQDAKHKEVTEKQLLLEVQDMDAREATAEVSP